MVGLCLSSHGVSNKEKWYVQVDIGKYVNSNGATNEVLRNSRAKSIFQKGTLLSTNFLIAYEATRDQWLKENDDQYVKRFKNYNGFFKDKNHAIKTTLKRFSATKARIQISFIYGHYRWHHYFILLENYTVPRSPYIDDVFGLAALEKKYSYSVKGIGHGLSATDMERVLGEDYWEYAGQSPSFRKVYYEELDVEVVIQHWVVKYINKGRPKFMDTDMKYKNKRRGMRPTKVSVVSEPHGKASPEARELENSYQERLAARGVMFNSLVVRADGLCTLDFTGTDILDLTQLKGMPLTSLSLGGTQVDDLGPLKGMPLIQLNLSRATEVEDLTPLKGMPLTHLYLGDTKVEDLTPLKGMPLISLEFSGTRVSDLTPLKGMTLTSLDLSGTRVSDLTPLKGMPLTSLSLFEMNVKNLEPLKGMPLTYLNLNRTKVKNLEPLKGMPLTWLGLQEVKLEDLSPLKGIQFTALNIIHTNVKNLEPLKGMPLTGLGLQGTKVENLEPLKGMQLTSLRLDGTNVKNLEPLKEMPLTYLNLQGTKVENLEPLKGMPITSLYLHGTMVSDLRALKDMEKLTEIYFTSKNIKYGMEELHQIKTLGKINGMPPADFWKKYDAGEFK